MLLPQVLAWVSQLLVSLVLSLSTIATAANAYLPILYKHRYEFLYGCLFLINVEGYMEKSLNSLMYPFFSCIYVRAFKDNEATSHLYYMIQNVTSMSNFLLFTYSATTLVLIHTSAQMHQVNLSTPTGLAVVVMCHQLCTINKQHAIVKNTHTDKQNIQL